jgi:protein involved in polysaccharide export with SLBB domain
MIEITRPTEGRLKKRRLLLVVVVSVSGWVSVQAQTQKYPAAPALPPPLSSSGANSSGSSLTPSAPPAKAAAEPTSEKLVTAAALINSMEALDDKFKLNVGDRISFRVTEDRDEAIQRFVTDSGEVDFPYVGRIKVLGKTCKQIALELKKLLEADFYYQATVIVGLDSLLTQARGKVWVVGQVRTVGPQELPVNERLTVSQAILRAGGFSDFADTRRVRLVRRGNVGENGAGNDAGKNGEQKAVVVDVKQIFDRGDTRNDPAVGPDDLIIVPQRLVNF